MKLYLQAQRIAKTCGIRICECKGTKKKNIRQNFFEIQKNMLSLQQNCDFHRIIFHENSLLQNIKKSIWERKYAS